MVLHGRGGGRGDRQPDVVGRGVVVGCVGHRYCRRSWISLVLSLVVVVVVVGRGDRQLDVVGRGVVVGRGGHRC